MIRAEGLTRMYGDFYAVRDVTFSIPRGQLVAFLGPNGAGKSTTMKLLTGSMAATSGKAFIAGIEVAADRMGVARKVGYLPENGPMYAEMTPISVLRFFGEARGLAGSKLKERIDFVIDECRLSEVIGKPTGKLSKGYRQRVGMAQALLHDPDVLIMDEPTAGLDPNQVEHVRDLLRGLSKTKTILLSTHILREVQAMASRVLVVSQGRLVHDGPVSSLGADEAAMEKRFRQLTGEGIKA
ncbi:MAG: ABC transporter ATP-binding protein [Phycisphaerales bacterium]